MTIPPEATVATDPVPLLQIPPEVELLSVVVEPSQTVVVPVIAPTVGSGLTVMVPVPLTVDEQVPLLTNAL